MNHYYDPMLFASTERHPSNAAILMTLSEPVDGHILQEATEELRERFPYFYVKPVIENQVLTVASNPLPIAVRNTWAPSFLCSKEVNYHLIAFKYEGNRLMLETSHILTDGSGIFPYVKSVMYCYLSRKTGKHFDPSGFRLPGDPIPETETGNPFEGLDLDAVEEPFYRKKISPGFYSLNNTLSDRLKRGKNIFLKVPVDQVIEFCKEQDGSPNVLFSVLLARAIRRMDPESKRTIVSGIAVNHKALLGNNDNYRAFSDMVYLDFPKSREHESLTRMCTVARGQLMLQTQPENSMYYVKDLRDKFEMTQKLPGPVKPHMVDLMMAFPRGTCAVSYSIVKSFGPLDPYIENIFSLVEPDVVDVLLEIICFDKFFFISFMQNFSSEEFFDAFSEELKETGITAEVLWKDRCELSGTRFDGISTDFLEELKGMISNTFKL